MKSLREQVQEILNKTEMTARQKAMALVKCGVTPYEAMALAQSSTPEGRPFTFSFGVEIECVNCAFYAFKSAARANGIDVYDRMSYNHDDMAVYKLVTDSSVHGNSPAECVTPPLSSRDGFSSLEACCKTLADVGATVNRTCGLHVHIGAASLTNEEYCNVFVNYMYLETAIESFMAPSRRGRNARWCASLHNHETAVLNATTKYGMRQALSFDRYHRVNAEAYAAHQTIEFRQHQGTTSYKKIAAWVRFLGKLVEWSKTHRLTQSVDTIDAIPFITAAEKRFFKSRKAEFEARGEQ